MDILDLEARDLPPDVDLLLAGPPCTTLSIASASHHREPDTAKSPKTATAAWHDRLLFHLFNLIQELDPTHWLVENPRGNMRSIPPFGSPDFETTLCQWGENRQKPTDFWGELPGFTPTRCSPGDDCHEPAPRGSKTGTQRLRSAADRALMPRALCARIKECATNALTGCGPQNTLSAFATTTTQCEQPRAGSSFDPFCEYCGTPRSTGRVRCCGQSLEHAHSAIHRCPDGHYTTTPKDCPYCHLEAGQATIEEVAVAHPYANWNHAHALPDDVPRPGGTVTVGKTTYWVPEDWQTVSFLDPEMHYTHDDATYEIEYTAVAAIPPGGGPAVEVAREATVADKNYPEDAAPVPRTPTEENRPASDTAWLGLPPWTQSGLA